MANKSSEKGKQTKKNKAGAPKNASKNAPKKESIFRKIANYVHNVRLEIKRTTWPTRDEVLRMSLIVIGALIFFGVFILVADWIMTNLLDLYSHFMTPDTGTGG